jgi:hypothetical protein
LCVKAGSSTVVMPGASAGTANSVSPLPRPAASSPLALGAIATTMITFATSPLVTNHLSPRIRQPSPAGSAVVAIPEGSEPACSSVTA